MRRPAAAAAMRGALGGGIEAAVEAVEIDVRGKPPSRSAVRSISATPGRKASSAALALGQRAADGGGHLVLDPLLGGAAEMDERRSDRLRPSLSITGAPPISRPKRAPSSVADMASEPQVGAQRRLRVERQREAEIAVEAALVDLVEQHRRNAGKLGIGLDARRGRCPR